MAGIDRIDGRSLTAKDVAKLVTAGRPVVVHSLLSDSPLGDLRSRARVIKSLGATRLWAHTEIKRPDEKRSHSLRLMTLGEIASRAESLGPGQLVVSEHPITPDLASRVRVPDACRFRFGSDGQREISSEVFFSSAGTTTDLHFDWDHRHVFLYQIFGRKRVFVVDPTCGAMFRPILNHSSLRVERLADESKRAIMAAVQAWEVLLGAGEAVLIPALAWHYVEYVDSAMSLSFRFGRTPLGRLVAETLHADYRLQIFLWRHQRGRLVGNALRALANILRVYASARQSGVSLADRIAQEVETQLSRWVEPYITPQIWRDESQGLLGSLLLPAIETGALYPSASIRRQILRAATREVRLPQLIGRSISH